MTTDETVQKKTEEKTANTTAGTPQTSDAKPSRAPRGGKRREMRKNRRAPRRKMQRSEFDQRILAIRRVTRVSAGGRRFGFSVAMAIGDGKGRIGVGTGKAGDTALAIEKAVKSAKKNLITIPRTKTNSIPHEVQAKYSSAIVKIQPSPGRGIVAGSAVRDMAELAGVNDIVAKIISGSKNKLNIGRATIKALEMLNQPKASDAPKKEAKKANK